MINLEELFAGDDRNAIRNRTVNGPGVECKYCGNSVQ